MRLLTAFILLAISLSSCKKFVHEDVEVEIPSCELCDWADSLEGDYDGQYLYRLQVSSMNINIQETHSFHFSVQHIFLGLGIQDDSTRMFFEVTRTGGNLSDETSIWVVDDSLGLFRNTGFDEIRMNRDSITLKDLDIQSAPGGGSAYVRREGVFYRQ